MQEFYDKLGYKIINDYGTLTDFFNEVITNDKSISLQDKLSKSLIKLVQEKIKLPELKLESVIIIKSISQNGIGLIKDTFKKAEDFAKKQGCRIKLIYISAPKYSLMVTAKDYKEAEKNLQTISEFAVDYAKKNKLEASWQKKS